MNDPQTQWVGVRLDPMDVLLFRDGRPFSAASKVSGGLPTPQTLAGALRTALLAKAGFKFDVFRQKRSDQDVRAALAAAGAPSWVTEARFRGPWLALTEKNGTPEPLLPVPTVLARAKHGRGQFYRAKPKKDVPGWVDPHGQKMLPLWHDEAITPDDVKSADGFLTLAGIQTFLNGGIPDEKDYREAGELFKADTRTGIGVNADSLTASDGAIYGVQFLVLKPNVCLYAEMAAGLGAPPRGDWLPEALPFGGEGRYCRAAVAVPWPSASGDEPLWLLATPSFAGPKPWPATLTGHLKAAASMAPLAVSGWDVAANGPQPLRFAVPAGSVYYTDNTFAPARGSLDSDAESVAQGWGFALRGRW